MHISLIAPLLSVLVQASGAHSKIDRMRVVQSFNPKRNQSSVETPLQVGNGNFAFGADVTGLQTFSPFATLSTWGWHNFSLPTTPGQTEVSDYHGTDWWTHGRLVNYNLPSDNESVIANWLRENPHRINLGRIGLAFKNSNVTEDMLGEKSQTLDMWTGTIDSRFQYKNTPVYVQTIADPNSDTIAVNITSNLLSAGEIGIFFDFPYPTNSKFEAPFVGVFNATNNHTSTLTQEESGKATIKHTLDATEYYMNLQWNTKAIVSGPDEHSHRYYLNSPANSLHLVIHFSQNPSSKNTKIQTFENIQESSKRWWKTYWNTGAFIDLTASTSSDAQEFQRIIVQSQYLEAINEASDLPPQESGLVNNGWYGKFHMEMYGWHVFHFARWNQWPLFWRSANRTYELQLSGAHARAEKQGYDGARWGKMMGNNFADGPGEINTLLIWQQPHPMYFAELEYRHAPTEETLDKWEAVISAAADFMYSYGFWNDSRTEACYELGPPMYPVSENTNPNATHNPTFELAYWRFGLEIASKWSQRRGNPVPTRYKDMLEKLCPLPIDNDTYPIYEDIPNMWTDNQTATDHPAMAGIFGLLPPPSSQGDLNLTIVQSTAKRIYETWDLENLYGWDFPMLAMNSLRLGDVDRAVEYLLHPEFDFDDAGYPTGGTRVPRPYFPSSGSFLLAAAMMAGGWDGEEYPHFPKDWTAQVEGFTPAL